MSEAAAIQCSDLKGACKELEGAHPGEPEIGRDDRVLWAKLRVGAVNLDVYWDSYSNGISVDLRYDEWEVGLSALQLAMGDQTRVAVGASDAASLHEAMRSVNAALAAPAAAPIVAGDREAWRQLMATVYRQSEDYTFRFTAETPPDEARAILKRAIDEKRLVEVRLNDGALRHFRPTKIRLDHRGLEVCIGAYVAGDGAPRAGAIPIKGLKAIALSDDESLVERTQAPRHPDAPGGEDRLRR